MAIQIYAALIASLMLVLWTNRKPNRRTWEMIQFYLSGWATLEEFEAHLNEKPPVKKPKNHLKVALRAHWPAVAVGDAARCPSLIQLSLNSLFRRQNRIYTHPRCTPCRSKARQLVHRLLKPPLPLNSSLFPPSSSPSSNRAEHYWLAGVERRFVTRNAPSRTRRHPACRGGAPVHGQTMSGFLDLE